MADSLCALWSSLDDVRKRWDVSPYREYAIPPNEAEAAGIRLVLKDRCERLGGAELFGPADDVLIERATVPAFYKRGELTGQPIHPAGLRIPLIVDRCETLIPQSGEVCPLWEKPFPSCPINTLEAVAEFLKLSKDVWFLDWQRKRDTEDERNLQRARRDLHNVRMTLTWLHDLGRSPLPPEWINEPTTARDCELMAANLLRWIDAPGEVSPTSAKTPNGERQPRLMWQDVLPKAESYVQRNGFPGLKALARQLLCHPTVLRKAIDNSEKLRAAEQRHKETKTARIPQRRKQRINDVLADSLKTKIDAMDSIATNDVFQRLVNAARNDDEREKLLKKSPEERRELVAVLTDDPDKEFRLAKAGRASGRDHVTTPKRR